MTLSGEKPPLKRLGTTPCDRPAEPATQKTWPPTSANNLSLSPRGVPPHLNASVFARPGLGCSLFFLKLMAPQAAIWKGGACSTTEPQSQARSIFEAVSLSYGAAVPLPTEFPSNALPVQ